MNYSLNDFCSEARAILQSGSARETVEKLRAPMERLAADAQFLDGYFGESQPLGLKRIHSEPGLGFELMTYRFDIPRTSQPHDHGESWAIYAQVREYTDMIEWERTDAGADPARAALKVKRQYRLNPGQAGVYFGRELHSTATPPGTRYLRITGTDLEQIPRLRIDAASGAIEQVRGRQLSKQS